MKRSIVRGVQVAGVESSLSVDKDGDAKGTDDEVLELGVVRHVDREHAEVRCTKHGTAQHLRLRQPLLPRTVQATVVGIVVVTLGQVRVLFVLGAWRTSPVLLQHTVDDRDVPVPHIVHDDVARRQRAVLRARQQQDVAAVQLGLHAAAQHNNDRTLTPRQVRNALPDGQGVRNDHPKAQQGQQKITLPHPHDALNSVLYIFHRQTHNTTRLNQSKKPQSVSQISAKSLSTKNADTPFLCAGFFQVGGNLDITLQMPRCVDALIKVRGMRISPAVFKMTVTTRKR